MPNDRLSKGSRANAAAVVLLLGKGRTGKRQSAVRAPSAAARKARGLHWTKMNSAIERHRIDGQRNPIGSDITVPRIVFAGLGGTIMAGLMYARHRFINWPLHYLGLPIATSRPISLGWFSIMIGWLFKLFIVRYGGVRLYRAIRPFFIGLIVGQISCGASWMALDYLTGMVGNWVSVGVP